MQSAVINFTTEEKIKQEAQKIAKAMGISLSTVLNRYLKHFVQTKKVVFTAEDEIPNKWLVNALKQSEADVKAGRVLSFDTPQDARSYVSSLIEHDRVSK